MQLRIVREDREMTPEKALGRLINLREQLTDKKEVEDYIGEFDQWEDEPNVMMDKDHYEHCIDDLDDIIRSIERGMMIDELVEEAIYKEPDSEDMERR
jgi:hypothetical protein